MPPTRDRVPGETPGRRSPIVPESPRRSPSGPPFDLRPGILGPRPSTVALLLLALLVAFPASLAGASPVPIGLVASAFGAAPVAGDEDEDDDDDDDEDADDDLEGDDDLDEDEGTDPAEKALLDAVLAHQVIPAAVPDRPRGRNVRGRDPGEDRESELMRSELRFDEVRRTYPDSRAAKEALYWIAECQRELGDHEIAVDTYARALIDDGGGTRGPEIRLGWGRSKIELEEFESCLAQLEEIARIAPDSPEHALSLYYRGIVLRELERFGEAQKLWEGLRSSYPNSTAARRAQEERDSLLPARERLARWLPEYQRLRKALDGADRMDRRDVIDDLGKHLMKLGGGRSPEIEQYLLGLYDDEPPEVRAAVIPPLLKVGGPRAASRILRDVKRLDEAAMTALMNGLKRKHFKKLRLDPFEGFLRAKQKREARDAAIDLFGRVGSAQAVSALVDSLPAGEAGVAISAQDRIAISRIEGRLRRVRDEKALQFMTRVLGGKKDSFRRATIADALGYTGADSVADDVRAAMFDPVDEVAAAAVRSVGRLGIVEASEDIARLLVKRRRDEAFVKEAVRTIGQLDPSHAESALIAVSDSRDRTIRALVIRSLGKVRTEAAIARIIEAFHDPAWQVRSAALEATEGLAQPEVVEALVSLLEREDGALLPKIITRLIALLGVDRGPNPADWREYWEFARGQYDPGTALAGGADGEPKGSTYVRRADPDAAATPTYFGVEIISKKIAFVVDCSGSMQAEVSVPNDDGGTSTMRRIDLAKDELLRAISALRPGTIFNIVKFDTNAVTWQKKPVKLSKKSVRDATRFAQGLGPGGATNIYDSLEMVLEAGEVDTIFLLSDGAPSAGKYVEEAAILREITRLNEESQVTIHTIALGFASEFMRELAERNQGTYVLAGQ